MASHPWKIVVFGATGFAGQGALKAALLDPRVGRVVTVTRRRLDLEHPKLEAVVHEDFLALAAVEKRFTDVDAVFYLLGISQNDVPDERQYRKITYDYAMAAARAVHRKSPRAVFHFLSGAGTKVDGRWMWARIKGETEHDLGTVGLGGVVSYRPALIVGRKGERSRYKVEAVFRPLEFLYRPIQSFSVRTDELGHAMLQATADDLHEGTLENKDIRALARRYRAAGSLDRALRA